MLFSIDKADLLLIVFEGVIIEPGQPTLVARMMSNRIWVDEDSTTGAKNLQM
jgi:hypothetical protein